MSSSSTADPTERDALIALSLIDGVGNGTLQRLKRERIRYSDAFAQAASSRDAEALHAQRVLVQTRAAALGCDLITFEDQDYPECLRDLSDPPAVLFTKGNRAMLAQPTVAVVGTRAVTRYGERIARELGAALAAAGACVISGLARGVDSAAHRGALDVDGHTCAVLGTGIDVAYPVAHATLQRTIGERGCLITEYLPGAAPSPGGFPRRNRIIAALAQLTIVVEAGRRSGARITAEHALDLGRGVAAVPGPIDSMQSAGSNELLRDGAHVITSVEEALSLVGLSPAKRNAPERDLSPEEVSVLAAIGERQLTTQQVVEMSALPVSQCLAAISSLEVDGLIEASLTGEFRRCRSASRRKMALSTP